MGKGKEVIHWISLAITTMSLLAILVQSDEKEKDKFSFYGDEVPPTIAVSQYGIINYLATLQYPPNAKENNIEGKVMVNFFVEPDGSISKPHLMPFHQPVDAELAAAAISFVQHMPKWNPGTKAGRRKRMMRSFYIKFKLK